MKEGTLVLEVGGVYRAEDGFLWEIVQESKEGFIGLRLNLFPPWDGASLFYRNGVSVRQRTKNLVSKFATVNSEVGEGIALETPAPKKSIAEELRETAEKHQTTEAVVQRLIDIATEAAKDGKTSIEIESSAFYDERLQTELYKHGFSVRGLFKQYGLMPSSSWLDSVYLSWGETDSNAGAR
jgi:hypothetical protein